MILIQPQVKVLFAVRLQFDRPRFYAAPYTRRLQPKHPKVACYVGNYSLSSLLCIILIGYRRTSLARSLLLVEDVMQTMTQHRSLGW